MYQFWYGFANMLPTTADSVSVNVLEQKELPI